LYILSFKRYHNPLTESVPFLFRERGPLTSKQLTKFREVVKNDLGFDFRACRRTFYQQLLDMGIDSDDGSVVMGNTVGVL